MKVDVGKKKQREREREIKWRRMGRQEWKESLNLS